MNARGLPDTPVMNTHGGPRAPAGNGEYDAAAAQDGEFRPSVRPQELARGSLAELDHGVSSPAHAPRPALRCQRWCSGSSSRSRPLSSASALVVGSPRVVTRSGAASLSMGIAAFRTGDKVQVITGADKGAVGKVRAATQLLARPAAALRARARPHAVSSFGPPPPRVISVDRKKGKVTVEGVNIRSKHEADEGGRDRPDHEARGAPRARAHAHPRAAQPPHGSPPPRPAQVSIRI